MSVLNLDRIFITSDLHIGHALLAELRGFAAIREHDEEIIRRWNEVVTGRCDVYLLGDIGFRCSPGYLSSVIGRMNGRKVLLRGNHDGLATKALCRERFERVLDVFELKGYADHKLSANHLIKIWMSHYAHRHWPSWNHGSVNLHGHSHGKLPPMKNQLDVGIDCTGLRPITLREALDRIVTLNETLTTHVAKGEMP